MVDSLIAVIQSGGEASLEPRWKKLRISETADESRRINEDSLKRWKTNRVQQIYTCKVFEALHRVRQRSNDAAKVSTAAVVLTMINSLECDLRTQAPTELFTCRLDYGRIRNMEAIPLKAIAIDPRNSNLFAVGGMDKYARLYDIRRVQADSINSFSQAADHFCPPHLIGLQIGITGLAFSEQKIFHGIQEEVMATTSRSNQLKIRLQHIEATVPPLEKAMLAQTSHIHFAYTGGIEWHPCIPIEQNHLIYNVLPQCIMDLYEECRDTPLLHLPLKPI